jgi:hypothetical protein
MHGASVGRKACRGSSREMADKVCFVLVWGSHRAAGILVEAIHKPRAKPMGSIHIFKWCGLTKLLFGLG